jgi:O-acetyl-ADP-ribose deacetylase (regulator of RNase III)
MKIAYVTGDATHPIGPGPKIIAHICNNVGAWGAGFTGALSGQWPQAEREYRRHFRQYGWKLGDTQIFRVDEDIIVANMVAQQGIGKNNPLPPIRYPALSNCLDSVRQFAVDVNASVHMPRIGTGLAGGSWDRIEPIIQHMLCDRDISVTVYDLPWE